MPTRIPVVIDTVRVVLRDTIVVRDTLVRLQAGPSWVVPAITATATLAAALLAQWCAVLFSRWEHRRHVISRLASDLEAMRRLLKEMASSHSQEKGVHASVLAQVDLLCKSYQDHERNIVHAPPRIARPVRLFYAELIGFLETLRLIYKRNEEFRAGIGTGAGAGDLGDTLSQVPNLRKLCVDAEAAVRVEEYRHLWWFFLRMRWRVTHNLDLRSHIKMTREIDEMQALIEKEDENP